MTAEQAAIYITIFGAVGTCANIWIMLNIRNGILGVKLWATDKFVAKDDMTTYLSPLKDSIQMVGSARRLQGLDPAHDPATR